VTGPFSWREKALHILVETRATGRARVVGVLLTLPARSRPPRWCGVRVASSGLIDYAVRLRLNRTPVRP
jgi:hypothetical protein